MRRTIILSLITLIIACNKHAQRNNEITKVELARSGAWADNGAAISVDSSLNYKYYDGNVKQGYYWGKISAKLWDTLNRKFEEIKFKTIQPVAYRGAEDVNIFELIIHWKGGKRRILREWYGKPDPISNTVLWLNNSYKSVKLHRIQHSIAFETTYQIPPPKPKLDQIKFPPPIKQ